jgi:protein-S-isoprenylcysteine O-methyltransferase Ste14
MLLGLILNISGARALRKMNTPVEFHETPITLVTTGPFRFSRNPIYLGGVIILLGLAILFGSLITFIFPILLFIILNEFYIPFEEITLEENLVKNI